MFVGRALLLDEYGEGAIISFVLSWGIWRRGLLWRRVVALLGGVWGRWVPSGYLDPQTPASLIEPSVSRRER